MLEPCYLRQRLKAHTQNRLFSSLTSLPQSQEMSQMGLQNCKAKSQLLTSYAYV